MLLRFDEMAFHCQAAVHLPTITMLNDKCGLEWRKAQAPLDSGVLKHASVSGSLIDESDATWRRDNNLGLLFRVCGG